MDYYNLDKKEVLSKLHSSLKGLSESEARNRLEKYGTNYIEKEKRLSGLKIFLSQFKDVIVFILIFAIFVSLFLGHLVDAIVIGAILFLNAILGFVQEFKAEKSVSLLRKLSSPKAKVLRNDKYKIIDSKELVVGDIVILEQGDKVSADGRLIDVVNLQSDESILTGESTPVAKFVKAISGEKHLAERHNMVFSGTIISSGRGKFIVTNTGMASEIGKVAHLVQIVDTSKTPLEGRLKRLGMVLGGVAVLIVLVILFLGILKQLDFYTALLTSISLAVAVIPEGLPAVVTICLALGLQRMLKQKALVRRLKAVETLGSTSHICVPGNTLVFGNPSINEIKDVEENQRVLGIDGSFHYVKKTFRRPYSGEMVSIKPVGLPEVKLTPNHPIFVSKMIRTRPCIHDLWPIKRPRITKLSKPEWLPAGQITKDYVVLVPRIKKEEEFFLEFRGGHKRKNNKILFDEELAELFGWYLAEGCCSSNKGSYSVVFYLGKHEREYVERLKYLIKKKFGLKSFLIEKETALRLSFNNKDLVEFFEREFGKKAINKKIPNFVLNSKKENIVSFIRSYLKGDGTVSPHILSLRFSTASKVLAYQLVLLLNKIGIKGKIYHDKHRPFSFIRGRKVKRNDCYTVIINGTQADRIYPLHRELKKKKRNLDLFDDDFVYYTIRKISKKYETLDVYNIETESQSYCLPFIVHNCADKTGTITKNEMTVREIFVNDKLINVTGEGYDIRGDFLYKNKKISSEKFLVLLEGAASCNNSSLPNFGDPTELALLVMARKGDVIGIEERVSEEAFSSVKKYMMTTHITSKGEITYIKGAVEKVLELCDYYYVNGKEIKLSKSSREKFLNVNSEMADKALRVLGIAYRKNSKTIFIGLCGMIDPPRPEIKDSIKLCNDAGIKVVMITGDHRMTAEAIAKQVGIKGKVVEGKTLDKISNSELREMVDSVSIFARVNPEHKVRILGALQSKDHVVAMTGDGVNDAPALKKSDVGVAMNIKGTDVARGASDMVLLDDNFATIVLAVKEGRVVYDNIKKFVKFLLSSNIDEFLIIFITMLFGFPLPLLPLQILWINLITDGLPALALSVDNPEKGIMLRKPREKGESILKNMWPYLLGAAIFGTIAGLVGYFSYLGDIDKARTMVLTVVVMFEMFWVFTCRSEKYSIFELGNNKWLYLAVIVSICLHVGMMYSGFAGLFGVVALGLFDWFIVIGLSCIGFVFFEGKKLIFRK